MLENDIDLLICIVIPSDEVAWGHCVGHRPSYFPDYIFQLIFLNKNVWITIKIALKFVPKGPIYNISTLVQIMAWRRPGDKPLSEPMWLGYRRIYASLGLNECNSDLYSTVLYHVYAGTCCMVRVITVSDCALLVHSSFNQIARFSVIYYKRGWKSPWWHHQMETLSALLALCERNSSITGEFPQQRLVTRSFDVFFDLRLE